MIFNKLPKSIDIGYEGEQNSRPLELDISEGLAKWAGSVPTLLYIRPGENLAVPAATTLDDGILTWIPDAYATAKSGGNGALQIVFTIEATNTVIGKSQVIPMTVNASLIESEDPPEPYESWIASLLAAAAEAEGSAQDAEAWAKGTRGGTAVESTDPAWHANAAYHAGQAGDSAQDAEAWAVGKRGGADVGSSDPAYHNNAKYYAEQAAASAEEAGRSYAPAIRTKASGAVAHFTDGAVGLMALDIVINPNQAGSGDPSPSNVRAISGFTGVNATRTGKNLIPTSDLPITLTMGTVRTKAIYFTTVLPAGTYTLNVNVTENTATKTFTIGAYRTGLSSSISLSGVAYSAGETGTKSSTFNAPNGVTHIYMYLSSSEGTGNGVVLSQITVEPGTTADAYEPYQGNDYLITLPSSAGTVYGGNLHINQDGSGVLTVDRAITTVNDHSWSYNSGASQRRFASTFSDIRLYSAARTVPFTSSVFVSIDDGRGLGDVPNNGIYGAGTSTTVYIKCTDYSTESAFKEAYGSAQIVYPIANPSTYTFTATQISSLLGENNVWADTGDVTAEYTADTKTYIERLTQPDQDWIADAGISDGEYFMVGNELYIATIGIAAGETIIPGTNCTKKSLAEALNAINA